MGIYRKKAAYAQKGDRDSSISLHSKNLGMYIYGKHRKISQI